jgi:hypothetical protein
LIDTLPLKLVFLTFLKGLNQSMRLPCLAQNFSGFLTTIAIRRACGYKNADFPEMVVSSTARAPGADGQEDCIHGTAASHA